jgi:hypothetical protein
MASSDNVYYDNVATLGGSQTLVDTPLEIALLSLSAGVVDIRPVEAQNILPANNRTSALKLGAAVYKELVELKFLASTSSTSLTSTSLGERSRAERDAIGRYEGMLHFISERNGVSRAEIEAYFRQGIGGLIAETVDAEFNKISFLLENSRTYSSARSHSAVLTRDVRTGQYILSYGGTYTNNETRTITANSLEALSSEMRNGRYKADFDQTGIDQVRTQAALIPAAVYARWQTVGVAQGTDALALVKETLTRFYLEPSRETYEAVRGIYSRYRALSTFGDPLATNANIALISVINSLNPAIYTKITSEVNTNNLTNMARIPNDVRFNIFATRSDVGGER